MRLLLLLRNSSYTVAIGLGAINNKVFLSHMWITIYVDSLGFSKRCDRDRVVQR